MEEEDAHSHNSPYLPAKNRRGDTWNGGKAQSEPCTITIRQRENPQLPKRWTPSKRRQEHDRSIVLKEKKISVVSPVTREGGRAGCTCRIDQGPIQVRSLLVEDHTENNVVCNGSDDGTPDLDEEHLLVAARVGGGSQRLGAKRQKRVTRPHGTFK